MLKSTVSWFLSESNHIQPWLPRWVESHTESNYIVALTWNSYFEFQIWNLDLRPAYNRSNITILLYDVPTLDRPILFRALCLIWIPAYTNYILGTQLVPPGYGLFTQVLRNFPLFWICRQQEPIFMMSHTKNFNFQDVSPRNHIQSLFQRILNLRPRKYRYLYTQGPYIYD